MNANDRVKELKQELVREGIKYGLKGELDKPKVIIGAASWFFLEWADAYTLVNPLDIPPKRLPRIPRVSRQPRVRRKNRNNNLH